MILVTGASGFLGQHLVRHLSAQGKVARALYHHSTPSQELLELPGLHWMQCDLLDVYEVEEAMDGISEIYHCAAIVSFNPEQRDYMLHFNPESTANVVNQALVSNVRKMVYISSIAAIGRNDVKKEIDEETEWGESKYNSAYGLSKYLAETEVWRGIGEGLDAVIINPGIILGAGNWNEGSARIMKTVHSSFPYYTKGVTSWVGVNDVVKTACMLMDSDLSAERFIVSTGNYSFRDVFSLMATALSVKPPHIPVGKLATGIIWRLSALRHKVTGAPSLLTRETAANALGISVYDNRKLLQTFPSFAYTPIEKVISDMAQSFISTYKK